MSLLPPPALLSSALPPPALLSTIQPNMTGKYLLKFFLFPCSFVCDFINDYVYEVVAHRDREILGSIRASLSKTPP